MTTPVFDEDLEYTPDNKRAVSTPQKARAVFGNPPAWMRWRIVSLGGGDGYYAGVERVDGHFLYGGQYDWSMRFKGRFMMIGDDEAIAFLNSKTPEAQEAISNIKPLSAFTEFRIADKEYLVNIYPLDIPNGITHNENYDDFRYYFNADAQKLYESVKHIWGGTIMFDNMNTPSRTLGKIEKIDDRCYRFQGINISYKSEKDRDIRHFLSIVYNRKYCVPEGVVPRDLSQDNLYMMGSHQGTYLANNNKFLSKYDKLLIFKDGYYLVPIEEK